MSREIRRGHGDVGHSRFDDCDSCDDCADCVMCAIVAGTWGLGDICVFFAGDLNPSDSE